MSRSALAVPGGGQSGAIAGRRPCAPGLSSRAPPASPRAQRQGMSSAHAQRSYALVWKPMAAKAFGFCASPTPEARRSPRPPAPANGSAPPPAAGQGSPPRPARAPLLLGRGASMATSGRTALAGSSERVCSGPAGRGRSLGTLLAAPLGAPGARRRWVGGGPGAAAPRRSRALCRRSAPSRPRRVLRGRPVSPPRGIRRRGGAAQVRGPSDSGSPARPPAPPASRPWRGAEEGRAPAGKLRPSRAGERGASSRPGQARSPPSPGGAGRIGREDAPARLRPAPRLSRATPPRSVGLGPREVRFGIATILSTIRTIINNFHLGEDTKDLPKRKKKEQRQIFHCN